MRGLGSTLKQRKYAYNIMNSDITRQQAMIEAGYSKNVAENPARVENSQGFKLAMAKQAYQAGNLVSGMMNEIEARGYKDYNTKELLQAVDTISKVFERFKPKEKDNDSDVARIFGGIISGETSENVRENSDNVAESSELDSNDNV